MTQTLHELKHGSPETVLHTLRDLCAAVQAREGDTSAVLETLDTSLSYLEKRRPRMEYARFQAAGYPIGSGSIESANKLVVEARLKGAGRHWARPHVDPMLALRTIACSDRWDEAWPQMTQQLRQQAKERRTLRPEPPQAKQRPHARFTTSVTTTTTTVTPELENARTETAAPVASLITPTPTTSTQFSVTPP